MPVASADMLLVVAELTWRESRTVPMYGSPCESLTSVLLKAELKVPRA